MLRRLSILMILANWSFAWFSASVHVHHGHACNHDAASVVSHSHGGKTDGHCHSHSGFAHSHAAGHKSPDKGVPENKSSLSGICLLCDLTALELAVTPVAELVPYEVCVAAESLPSVTAPTATARYALRGRAPPSC
jgi:hypothetical protein